MRDIQWHGFLDAVLDPVNRRTELAAFLFSSWPYREGEVWHVLQVKNIGLKGDTFGGWWPDKADMALVKGQAKKQSWVKLGNVHTHPISHEYAAAGYANDLETAKHPSETDLKFAARFNDIVRGIVVVDHDSKPPTIPMIRFHDKFDRTIDEIPGYWKLEPSKEAP